MFGNYVYSHPSQFGLRLYIENITQYVPSILLNISHSNVTTLYTREYTPAYLAGLKPSYIISINGEKVYTLKQFENIYYNLKPGENITLVTTSGTYNIKPIYYGEGGKIPFIGILVEQIMNPYIYFILTLLLWLSIINIGIGIANMLPIYPMDGGRAFKYIMDLFFDDNKSKKITYAVSLITLGLIIYNMLLLFIWK